MAQAVRNKDVRKNCIDVERVIMECLSGPEREEIHLIIEPAKSIKLSKEVLKYSSKYNAKYNQELIPINRVYQKMYYRNYAVY
ncbi:MAG: hypothetical protein ACFE9M_12885 [Promethearchaeota archaeon]